MTTRPFAARLLRGLGLLVVLALLVLALAIGSVLWREQRSPQQAAPPIGRWVHAHDVELYIQEFGDPVAPPLLLTHGTGAWSGTWASNVQAMAAAGYRVIAVDLPPFGFSTRPAQRNYGRADQAQRLLALVDALRLGPVTLLGHSYGGGPAAEAAMLGPDRVRRLVLVDAAIGLQADPPVLAPPDGPLARAFGWRPLRTALVAAVGTQPLFSSHWLRQFVARKEVVTPQRTAIYQQPFVLQGFSESLGDWAVQFAGENGASRSEQPQSYAALKMPVTLVWGAQDSITPLAQAQRLHALLPQSRLVVLPGVGHIPQIEDVALFNQRISEVLALP